ncbi:unnamed protein product, partial [Vitis vinifera]|uniref:K+ potassium transporter integral membrane domain-containing protein n=1 Tax=Vitis vinifera TaxID=29760 RepID=D7TR58_VITVI
MQRLFFLRWSYACAKQLIERLVYVEGVEHGLEFSIMKAFNWIGPRMDFIPSIDGFSEVIPRVLPCFSNVSFNIFHNMYDGCSCCTKLGYYLSYILHYKPVLCIKPFSSCENCSYVTKKIPRQVYILEVNWMLMCLCLTVTIRLRETNMMSHAYGINLSYWLTMLVFMGMCNRLALNSK